MGDKQVDDGGPAFPAFDPRNSAGAYLPLGGMTLLDWFAGKALASRQVKIDDDNVDSLAFDFYKMAVAMIAEKRRRERCSAP